MLRRRARRGRAVDALVRRAEDEAALIVERMRELHEGGTPYEDMALLFRTNARSADFEEALTEAEIPFQGAAFLSRDGARQLLKALRRAGRSRRCAASRSSRGCSRRFPTSSATARSRARTTSRGLSGWRTSSARAPSRTSSRTSRSASAATHAGGVHLLTYHRAKGLEFDAVFLPRLEEKELPSKLSKTDAAIAEERRLLYVGLTRAKRHLTVTWSGKPSRFLAELGIRAPAAKAVEPDDPLYAVLKKWRLETAKAEERPAYVIFHNSTLAEIVRRGPRSREELAAVPGVGPVEPPTPAFSGLRSTT